MTAPNPTYPPYEPLKPFQWSVELLGAPDLLEHPDGVGCFGLYRTDALGARTLVMYTRDVSQALEQRNYFTDPSARQFRIIDGEKVHLDGTPYKDV